MLTLGTNDTPGDASADYTRQFAADLNRISGGLLTIEIKYRAGGEDDPPLRPGGLPSWSTAGDLDLGLAPTRAFDELGVKSLQALQAPFLVTDDQAMDAVVSSEFVGDLLSGLPSAGYEGLALWPEGLRHPYSFGAPILTLADFDGLAMRCRFRRRPSTCLRHSVRNRMTSPTLVRMTTAPSPGSGPSPTSTGPAW